MGNIIGNIIDTVVWVIRRRNRIRPTPAVMPSVVPIKKLSITRLPAGIQQNVYEFSGPCEKTKRAFEECMKFFKTGLVGIPYWEITMNRLYVNHKFITPSYELYRDVKVKQNKWWFPQDLDSYYYKEPTIPKIFTVTFFHTCLPHLTTIYPYGNYQKSLRNNTFMTSDILYFRMIDCSQLFEAPVVPISFQDANDYDILYSLKYVRERGTDLYRWAKQERVLAQLDGDANLEYIARIVGKWVKKGYK
jgi:hypothetical protein